jgi:hypothetical protein
VAAVSVWTPDKVVDIRKFAGLSIDTPEEARQSGVVQVIYGAPGSGKTTAAAQLVGSKYCQRGAVWLNADAGQEAIQHLIDTKQVQNIPITSYSQVESFTKEYSRDQPWDLVVLDNITEFQSLIHKQLAPDGPTEIQHYNTSTAKIMSLAREWRLLAHKYGLTVLMLAWEFASTDREDRGKGEYTVTRRSVDLSDKLGQRFPGVVGTCIHITVEGDSKLTRKMALGGASTRTQAKLRRDEEDSSAWTIPYELYYRRGEKPLVDIITTLKENVPFPIDKYQRRAANA